MMRSRKFVLIVLALFALLMVSGLGGFTVAPVAAQSSTNYDLGCWGVFVGGDTRQTPTYTLRDAVGQWAAGIASSPTVILRGGAVQNWTVLSTPPSAQVAAGEARVFQLYLPIVARHIRVIRTCTW